MNTEYVDHRRTDAASGFERETIVLTRRGLVTIDAVLVGDAVLTNELQWRDVVATRNSLGATVRLTGGGAAIECTPDRHVAAASTSRVYQPKGKFQPLEGAKCLHCKTPIGLSASGWPKTAARLYCDRTCNQLASRERAKLQVGDRTATLPEDLEGLWIATPILGGSSPAFSISRSLTGGRWPHSVCTRS